MAIEPDRGVGPLPPESMEVNGEQHGQACDSDKYCAAGTVCYNGYCVGTGALRFSLAFNVDSDFDLHVITPAGNEIFYLAREHDGGYLDVDQCVSPCGPGTHVENVFFQGPLHGVYQFYVQNFTARTVGDFVIDVAMPGAPPQRFPGFVGMPSRSNSNAFSLFY